VQFSGFCGCAKTAVSANNINCPTGLAADSCAATGKVANIPRKIANDASTKGEDVFLIDAKLIHF
jgi:hypothetical protein